MISSLSNPHGANHAEDDPPPVEDVLLPASPTWKVPVLAMGTGGWVFEEIARPDVKSSILGVIDVKWNFVGPPRVVADRLVPLARVVGGTPPGQTRLAGSRCLNYLISSGGPGHGHRCRRIRPRSLRAESIENEPDCADRRWTFVPEAMRDRRIECQRVSRTKRELLKADLN